MSDRSVVDLSTESSERLTEMIAAKLKNAPVEGRMNAQMEAALINLYQRRMDRCQNEQIWVLATLIATDGFVVSNRAHLHTFSCIVLFVMFGLMAVTGYILWERLKGYYAYRNQIAEYYGKYEDADKVIRTRVEWWQSASAWTWIFVFLMIIVGSSATSAYFLLRVPTAVTSVNINTAP